MPRLRKLFQRADVRLGLRLGGGTALLMAALLAVLFVISSHEAAEVLEETLEGELRRVAEILAAPVEPEECPAAGGAHVLFGPWPRDVRVFPDGPSKTRLAFAGPRDWFADALPLPDGGRLEGRIRLTGFVEERHEQIGEIAL